VRAWIIVSLWAAVAVGCGGSNAGPPGAAGASASGGAGGGGGQAAGGGGGQAAGGACAPQADGGETLLFDGGACPVAIEQHPNEGAAHQPTCLPPLTYCTRPPSSGTHYPIWADFKTYTTPVPWGHLVHDLEHGAIVIVYNCPGGCPDEVAAAQAVIDAFPADPLCASPTRHRLILAPDPTLDVRWAAAAWTWTIRAPCFDPIAFGAFMQAHYGQGGEDLCFEQSAAFCDVSP
jgi:hypothetical protein